MTVSNGIIKREYKKLNFSLKVYLLDPVVHIQNRKGKGWNSLAQGCETELCQTPDAQTFLLSP